MNDSQLVLAVRGELIHLAAVGLFGLLTTCFGCIAWFVRRDIVRFDTHLQSVDEKLDELAEKISWAEGVIHASGLAPRPLGPGIGGIS